MTITMPMQSFGPNQTPVSRIALGCMGLAGTWNPAEVGPEHRRRAIAAFEAALEAGITFYDHADIYGGTACESIFKDCLAAVPGSREKIFIATKVGIRRGYYEHDPAYIRQSVQGSLERLGIDVIDCYQLHRPDPLSHPAQTAEVLDSLVAEGLIKSVGIFQLLPAADAGPAKVPESADCLESDRDFAAASSADLRGNRGAGGRWRFRSMSGNEHHAAGVQSHWGRLAFRQAGDTRRPSEPGEDRSDSCRSARTRPRLQRRDAHTTGDCVAAGASGKNCPAGRLQ